MKKNETLIGDYVHYIHLAYQGGTTNRSDISGFLENVQFDNNMFFIKIEGDNKYYSVYEDDIIIVDKIKTGTKNYNL